MASSSTSASPPAANLRAQGRRFEAFLRTYNKERSHEALGQTPPAMHYQPATRVYSGRLRAPEYAAGWQVRRVRHSGEIKWQGRTLYISESLAGEPVGLAEQENGAWAVWYGPVALGSIGHNGRFKGPSRKDSGANRCADEPKGLPMSGVRPWAGPYGSRAEGAAPRVSG